MTTPTTNPTGTSARLTLATQAFIRARHESDFNLTLDDVTDMWQAAHRGDQGPWLAQVAAQCTPREVLDEALATQERAQRTHAARRPRVVRVRRGTHQEVTHR